MTAIYEESVPLQVFQHDILEVVTAAPRLRKGRCLFANIMKQQKEDWDHLKKSATPTTLLIQHDHDDAAAPLGQEASHSPTTRRERSDASPQSPLLEESPKTVLSNMLASLNTLVDGLLTGEHLRQLLQETLVRVKIPLKKRASMIHGNSFLQSLLEAHVQRQERQHNTEEKNEGPHYHSHRRDTAHAPSSPPSSKDAVAAAEEHYAHRVGRVVGILLKPSVAFTLSSSDANHVSNTTGSPARPASGASPSIHTGTSSRATTSTSASGTNPSGLQVLPEAIYANAALWTSPTSWQVVVHFGDRVEVMPLAAVSNTAMREDEHRVWVRTSLFHGIPPPHHPTGEASASSNALSNLPYVMSGEAGVLKIAQIQRLRHILHYLQWEEKTRQRLQAKECHIGSSSSAMSNPNDEDEEVALERVAMAFMKKEAEAMASIQASARSSQGGEGNLLGVKEDEEQDEDSDGEEVEKTGRKRRRRASHDPVTLLSAQDAAASSSTIEKDYAVQKQRMESLLAEKEMHVQQYRQLLSQKDRDLRNVLQQGQEADSQHAATLSQYDEKVRQGEQERMQLLRANEQASQQHASQLATASEKLLRMAQLAQKYKNVYEEALLLAKRWTAGGAGETEKKGGAGDSETGDRHWTVDAVLQTLKQMP